MNITLFNKKYWVRRFGEQRNVRGYLTSGMTDFIASLHIHPAGSDQQQALPEGERRLKHLEGHGMVELVVANYNAGVKGDLLLYDGEWYECVNAQKWDHTLLNHINYTFTLVPNDAHRTIDTQNPPATDPNEKEDGYAVYQLDMKAATDSELGGVIVREGYGLMIDSDGYLLLSIASPADIDDVMNEILGRGDGA